MIRWRYSNLIYFNKVDAGNHFAAWQEPKILTTEVRAAFGSLRNGGSHHFAAWEEPELFSAEVRAAFRSLRTNGGAHE
jgi:hypothetical protein